MITPKQRDLLEEEQGELYESLTKTSEGRMVINKQKVQPEDSLNVFFRNLGFMNFLSGYPYGGYGMDWGFIGDNQLDALSGYVPRTIVLIRATRGPDNLDVTVDGAMISRNFGIFEAPYVYLKDGRSFFFPSAMYVMGEEGEGYFLVEVRPRANERDQYFHGNKKDLEKDEGVFWYTVQELREMCGMPLGSSPCNVKSNEVDKQFVAQWNLSATNKYGGNGRLSSINLRGDRLRIVIIVVALALYAFIRPYLI